MATLLEAGLSMAEAFVVLAANERSHKYKKMYQDMSDEISKGVALSEIISQRKISINSMIVGGIQIGEKTGELSVCIRQAGEAFEKTHTLQKKIIGSLIYPCCILLFAIGMVLVIVCYIFPQILPVLTSLQIPLPLLTRVLIFTSKSFTSHWAYILILPIIAFIFAQQAVIRISKLKYLVGLAAYRMPFLSSMIIPYRTAQSCRSLALQLSSDVSLSDAWALLGESTRSLPSKDAYCDISKRLLHGEALSAILIAKRQFFSSILTDMVHVGERTGTLEKSLSKVAEMCESTAEQKVKNLTSILEPLFMVGIGLIIGACALGILMPIYEVTQHIH